VQHNINALRHEEFEELSQSLVQQIIGPGAKIYGIGRDGAREATFHGKASYPSEEEKWDGDWIFQAKFHDINKIGQKNAQNKIIAELDEELQKIKQLCYKCDNYILITNVSLSPVYKRGVKDRIDNEIVPKYPGIKHIHVWGFEEVSRFLDHYSNIRKTYKVLLLPSDVIALLLESIQKEDANLVTVVKLYCQGCFDNEYSAVLDDAGDTDDKLPLDKIFIDLDVKPSGLPSEQRLLELIPEWLKRAHNGERTSALSYLLDDEVQGLVLVGGPGSGKSTLGQGIAQIHRGCILGKITEFKIGLSDCGQGKARLPYRILLREYAQWVSSQIKSGHSDNLFYYISQSMTAFSGRETSMDMVQKIIQKMPVLLILDGLDEVSDKKLRTKILENINSFSNQVREILNGDLRVIATTRPHGYSEEFDPKHFLHLNLQKVSFEKATSYARLWANSRVNPADIERTLDTFKICIIDKVVGILSQSPLQITILLVIIRARGSPPKQREELFDRYMDIIYQRETKRRPELLQTDRELIYGLHKYIAYTLHKRAEKDATAALMDSEEFKSKVTEYLVNTDPLLDGLELEEKANQIMREAGLRLVLIEGVQEGKIGFGLTSIREFFAAAHLVDNAKNTVESDTRFKAIATLPHWRNVALFFAGRVGRNRPGEAPSMIDICRSIDIEGIDRLLKRGAKLVSDIVDDRDLREPHNEISAIQYSLTLIETGYVEKPQELALCFKGLPTNYKEKVIIPWLEEKLKNATASNVDDLVFYYQAIAGNRQPLRDALKKVAINGPKERKLWAFSQALDFEIAEPWTIQLLEELSSKASEIDLRACIQRSWFNLAPFLKYDVNDGVRAIIAAAILQGIFRSPTLFFGQSRKYLQEYQNFEGLKYSNVKNYNFINLIFFFNDLMRRFSEPETPNHNRNTLFSTTYPVILEEEIRPVIEANKHVIHSFLKDFSLSKKEPLINLMLCLSNFILNPENAICHLELSKAYNIYNNSQSVFAKHLVRIIAGPLPENSQENIYRDFNTFVSSKMTIKDTEVLKEKLSARLLDKPVQVLAVIAWLHNRTILFEQDVDSSLKEEIQLWLDERKLTRDFFSLVGFDVNYRYREMQIDKIIEQKLQCSFIEDLSKHIDNGFRIPLWLLSFVYKLDNEETSHHLLTELLNKILRLEYTSENDPDLSQLESAYWAFLESNIITEQHMSRFYELFRTKPYMPRRKWFSIPESNQTISNLTNFFLNSKLSVKRLAGVSFQIFEDKKIVLPPEIGNELWELSKDKQDPWNSRYLKIMSNSSLSWVDNFDEWQGKIKSSKIDNLENEWCDILERAGCAQEKDKLALLALLTKILETENCCSKKIKKIALRRLAILATEMQSSFDEKPLNLPLPKRKNIVCHSCGKPQ
jgi:hypothetical protein